MLPIAQEHGQVAREHDSGCREHNLALPFEGGATQVAREHDLVLPCLIRKGSNLLRLHGIMLGMRSQVAREHAG